ncbi:hypothetical protein EJ08DRAFT_480272 [Tothia fuscella]|uniref:Uncharacterized protein n=1 Tax=Tothia fuscella TaxID=1048955 RepID=A0A9P4NIN2_9PEZI|nr:hypothetical protein EJ08DRAFT_480272 [Tothia fuscella]
MPGYDGDRPENNPYSSRDGSHLERPVVNPMSAAQRQPRHSSPTAARFRSHGHEFYTPASYRFNQSNYDQSPQNPLKRKWADRDRSLDKPNTFGSQNYDSSRHAEQGRRNLETPDRFKPLEAKRVYGSSHQQRTPTNSNQRQRRHNNAPRPRHTSSELALNESNTITKYTEVVNPGDVLRILHWYIDQKTQKKARGLHPWLVLDVVRKTLILTLLITTRTGRGVEELPENRVTDYIEAASKAGGNNYIDVDEKSYVKADKLHVFDLDRVDQLYEFDEGRYQEVLTRVGELQNGRGITVTKEFDGRRPGLNVPNGTPEYAQLNSEIPRASRSQVKPPRLAPSTITAPMVTTASSATQSHEENKIFTPAKIGAKVISVDLSDIPLSTPIESSLDGPQNLVTDPLSHEPAAPQDASTKVGTLSPVCTTTKVRLSDSVPAETLSTSPTPSPGSDLGTSATQGESASCPTSSTLESKSTTSLASPLAHELAGESLPSPTDNSTRTTAVLPVQVQVSPSGLSISNSGNLSTATPPLPIPSIISTSVKPGFTELAVKLDKQVLESATGTSSIARNQPQRISQTNKEIDPMDEDED